MNDHERSAMITGASIIVAILIAFFGMRPLLVSYHQNSLRSHALAKQIDDLQARKTQLLALQQDLAKYQTQINQLAIAAPSGPDYPEVLAQLSALASKNQVTLSSVLPGRSSDSVEQVPITLTVRGNYPQLISFVAGIERNLRPISVNSLALISGNDPKQAQTLTATIQLTFARSAEKGTR